MHPSNDSAVAGNPALPRQPDQVPTVHRWCSRLPPEDCGGTCGYEKFPKAISRPKHERHEELLEWVDGEFAPKEFDGEEMNRAGKLAPLSYGRMAAVHLANVERKPLFHFFPGEIMLSLGSLGCNFRCPGCQNRELAHADVSGELSCVEFVSPESLVDQTLEQNLLGISFTYNEPAIWFEYTLDTFTCSSEAHRDPVFQGNLPRSTGHAISEAVQVLRPRFVLE